MEKEKKYCVYKHTNKINGKIYIGQTKQNPETRWQSGYGYRECSRFYNAIKKYGWENFEHEILKSDLTLEEANYFEKYYIKFYNSLSPNGYNLTEGGENYHVSEESRKKRSSSAKGRKLSEDTKKKLSFLASQRTGDRNHFTNKKHTSLTKEKIKNKTFERKINRPVICINFNFIFPSIEECARALELYPENIGNCCRGKVKKCGGLFFEYYDKEYDYTKYSLEKFNEEINQMKEYIKHHSKQKKVRCIEKNKIFNSIAEASRELNVNNTSIVLCCKKNRNKTAGGYHWEYVD